MLPPLMWKRPSESSPVLSDVWFSGARPQAHTVVSSSSPPLMHNKRGDKDGTCFHHAGHGESDGPEGNGPKRFLTVDVDGGGGGR